MRRLHQVQNVLGEEEIAAPIILLFVHQRFHEKVGIAPPDAAGKFAVQTDSNSIAEAVTSMLVTGGLAGLYENESCE